MNKHLDLSRSSGVGKKGFTIIELIVVIAIIAVLAGIVLVNVQQYVVRSRAAAFLETMGALRQAGAAFYEANGKYTGMTGDPEVVKIRSGIAALYGGHGSAGAWIVGDDYFCIQYLSPIPPLTDYYCVDNTGFVGDIGGTSGCLSSSHTCQ